MHRLAPQFGYRIHSGTERIQGFRARGWDKSTSPMICNPLRIFHDISRRHDLLFQLVKHAGLSKRLVYRFDTAFWRHGAWL